uniref:Store-operated calcium entry-associated regulatory factor n=1 Tax=Parascaris univalens TaxID=6257 RepID=A0A915CBF9_PARUN
MMYDVLLCLLLFIGSVVSDDRVRLTDVSTLTLVKGQYTTGRRSAPVLQLQCIGGSAKGRYEPRVVQCYNRGYDGVDVQWECKAEMRNEYVFGKIEVSCEGYNYPGDPFILKGSCGLKYELDFAGSESRTGKKAPSAPSYEEDSGGGGFIFWVVVVLVVVLFVFALVPSSASRTAFGDGTSRGGSGWDGGPPPPPGSGGMGSPPPPGFKTGQGYPSAPPTYDEACGTPNPAHAESSGPGFLSGLGLGGLAGYMLGRSQNRDYGTFRHRGASQFDRDTGFYDGPSTSRERRTPSPSTRTTSGFGGTSRR